MRSSDQNGYTPSRLGPVCRKNTGVAIFIEPLPLAVRVTWIQARWRGDAVVRNTDSRQSDPDSNRMQPYRTLGKFITIDCASSLTCMHEYIQM